MSTKEKTSVSMPACWIIFAHSPMSIAVLPFALGLPLIKTTFIDFSVLRQDVHACRGIHESQAVGPSRHF
jgi:hypothetical protein